jgi:hypothetical protein
MWETPIVRQLPPGEHIVQMSRKGDLVFEKQFSIDAGEEIVLTAWDCSKEGPHSERRDCDRSDFHEDQLD